MSVSDTARPRRAAGGRGGATHLVLAAAAILLITMGARQSLGLFVAPLHTSTGVGIVAISLALAIGQFVWGLAQPICGILADRYGSTPILVAGALTLGAGALLTTVVGSGPGLAFTLGVLFAAGAAAGSFSILIGVTAQRLPPEKRAFAAGIVNAGGSLGQFILAPITQLIISSAGWISAMYTLAIAALLTIPIARPLVRSSALDGSPTATSGADALAGDATLLQQLRSAARDRSYCGWAA